MGNWKWIKFKEDNRGSTLVTVLICVGILVALGLAMFAMSFMNYQMKIADKNAKVSFYDAETAVNEISTSLSAISETSLHSAMTYVEKYYAATPAIERSNFVNRRFTDILSESLKDDAIYVSAKTPASGTSNKAFYYETKSQNDVGVGTDTEIEFCKFLKKMTSPSSISCQVTVEPIAGKHVNIYFDVDDYYVEIQNVKVTCYDSDNGFATSVSTDIRVTPPTDNYFSGLLQSDVQQMQEYAVVADGEVCSTGNNNRIDGDVYGGSGIKASGNAEFDITANKIVSRKAFEAVDSAKITVLPTGSSIAQLWVRDIKTSTSAGRAEFSNISSHKGDNLNIKADCYVADDLILNNNGYDVTIDGNYYGYSTGLLKTSAKADGSAVSINARYANLTIAAIAGQSLWIAGKNMLDVNTASGSDNYVPQGESLTYKWTQDAYLLPGSCIIGGTASTDVASSSNPMPALEYNTLTANGTGKLNLDFSKYPFITKLNIEEYLDPNQPYIAKYVQLYTGAAGSAAQNVVYIYMNFLDETSANNYFAQYASLLAQRTQITTLANVLGYGKVNLNDTVKNGSSSDRYVGNIISFDSEKTTGTHPAFTVSYSSITGNITSGSALYDPFANSSTTTSNTTITNSSIGSNDVLNSESPYGSIDVAEANSNKYETDIINTENDFTSRYNGLISVLNDNVPTGYPSFDLVPYFYNSKNITDMNYIYKPDSSPSGFTDVALPVSGSGSSRKIMINSSNNKGIIIADCDVEVQGGVTFSGTIITTGNVILQPGACLQSDMSVSLNDVLTANKEKEDSEIANISYYNWKKS